MATTYNHDLGEEQLAFTRSEPLVGYQSGTVENLPTDESIVVVYGNGPSKTQAVLKTYNSYRKIGEKKYRPFVRGDLASLHPGSVLLVKVAEDGQLVGIIDESAAARKKVLPRKKIFGIF
jgi:hypothetical protein